MNKKERLEKVLEQIERDKFFSEKIEKLLFNEYELHGGNEVNHEYKSYSWNLDQTIQKQLKDYKRYRNKKNSSNYYSWLISAFKNDVSDEIRRLEINGES